MERCIAPPVLSLFCNNKVFRIMKMLYFLRSVLDSFLYKIIKLEQKKLEHSLRYYYNTCSLNVSYQASKSRSSNIRKTNWKFSKFWKELSSLNTKRCMNSEVKVIVLDSDSNAWIQLMWKSLLKFIIINFVICTVYQKNLRKPLYKFC